MTSVLIFLKYPVPGRVKTRLAKDVGEVEACRIYTELLKTTFNVCHQLDPDLFQLVALCEPSRPLTDYQSLVREFEQDFSAGLKDKRCEFKAQRGLDLGERLLNGLRDGLQAAESAMAIGTDCPTLQTSHLTEAERQLSAPEDLVLGPCPDGGYYLIGMTRLHPALFEAMPWSTDQVAAITCSRAQALGLRIHELAALSDIDTLEDLAKTDFAKEKHWG